MNQESELENIVCQRDLTMPDVALVIPCYKVRGQLLGVLESVPQNVQKIYVIDDACPEDSIEFVKTQTADPRLVYLEHNENRGVGAAVVSGYKEALRQGADFVIKIDGDGQMDLDYLPDILKPLINQQADYVKGNRFFNLSDLKSMPLGRVLGNTVLCFVNKLSSGYWNVMDPTNGYTAISTRVLRQMPLDDIDKGYFFESDMLFQLNLLRAKVNEIPMPARYLDETSSLSLFTSSMTFPLKYGSRFLKRIFYNYFLRDFSLCSLQIVSGSFLFLSGLLFGCWHWWKSIATGIPATSGTVMLAAVMTLLGMQFLLAAISYDISQVPRETVSKYL